MAKKMKSEAELNVLVAESVLAVPEIADDMRDDPRASIQPPTVYWHEHDGVANWNASGGRNTGSYASAISDKVEALRQVYDLEE